MVSQRLRVGLTGWMRKYNEYVLRRNQRRIIANCMEYDNKKEKYDLK